MTTVNERMRDEVLAHLINLHRYANSEVRDMLRLLNAADRDIFARLAAALERMSTGAFSVQRLASVLTGVWEVNEAVYRQMAVRSATDMRDLTEYELSHQQALFRDLLPDGLGSRIGSLQAQSVYAATAAQPFQGNLLKDWFDRLGSQRQERIAKTLNIGFVAGKTVDEMVRELRGSRAQNYADGLLEIDRRNAEAVVRTATAHTAAFARDAFYERNSDLIKEVQWVSTLDTRTTEECQIRDGLRYTADDHEPIGHDVPWLAGPGMLHWNCRSTSIPVIDAAEELGLDLPPLERAAMDGAAAPGTTYRGWITKQSAARQDDILGPTRGALLRSGGLSFDRFFNDKGVYLTLEQLRERDAKAFRKAGLTDGQR